MNGFTFLSNEDFRMAILTEAELEKTKQEIAQISADNLELINKLNELEEELKQLLLIITDGKERASYGDYNFSHLDINDNEEIAEYLNDNYLENGVLKFKKINKEIEASSKDNEV